MVGKLEEQVERIVYQYLLPSELYEHDNGRVAYISLSFLEVPFRTLQIIKNGIYHAFRMKHRHEESRDHFSTIGDF